MNCSRFLHGAAAAVACALLSAPAALAASTTTTTTGEDTPLNLDPPAQAVDGGGGGGIVRTIVGLAIVLGVIFGLHWVLKQLKVSREQRSTGGGLGTLSTLQLGPGRALHLVRSGSEIVLVGSAEHGVSALRVYSQEEARALGLLDEIERVHRDPPQDGRPNPLQAAAGSPPSLRELVRTVQRWTVRR